MCYREKVKQGWTECGIKATAEICWIENLHLTPCPQFQLKDGKKM